MAKKSFFQFALYNGYISEEQLRKAEEYKAETNVTDEKALLDTKILTEENLLKVYYEIYGYEIIQNTKNLEVDDLALKFKRKTLLDIGFIPVLIDNAIFVITSRPQNTLFAEDYIRETTNYKGSFTYALVTETNLRKLINKAFHV